MVARDEALLVRLELAAHDVLEVKRQPEAPLEHLLHHLHRNHGRVRPGARRGHRKLSHLPVLDGILDQREEPLALRLDDPLDATILNVQARRVDKRLRLLLRRPLARPRRLLWRRLAKRHTDRLLPHRLRRAGRGRCLAALGRCFGAGRRRPLALPPARHGVVAIAQIVLVSIALRILKVGVIDIAAAGHHLRVLSDGFDSGRTARRTPSTRRGRRGLAFRLTGRVRRRLGLLLLLLLLLFLLLLRRPGTLGGALCLRGLFLRGRAWYRRRRRPRGCLARLEASRRLPHEQTQLLLLC